MTKTSGTAGSLRRDLTLIDAVGIGFGAVIGAGVYVVTGIAAGIAGPALLLALLMAGAVAAANALSSAQLAARYPASGGSYEYGYQLLGPWPGFVAGWMFLASKIAAAGTVAIGLGSYVELLIPQLDPPWIATVSVVLFTILNYFGIRKSSRLNLFIVALSTGALLLLVAAGLPHIERQSFSPFLAYGWRSLFEASALIFFAYTGYARIATLGEEVSNPRRTIPRAILITIGGAIAIYIAVAAVAVGTVGAPALSSSGAPLGVVARAVGPAWLATALPVGALAAMLGVILSQLLGLSRMAFAMARRDDLPAPLATIHPRHHVPSIAVLVIGAIATIVAATGSLRGVASAAAFMILVYYGITNVAALRLTKQTRMYSPIVPAFGLFGCVVLALSLPLRTIATGIAILAAGALFRLLFRRAFARKG
ncbi:MAG TPA: amino acid permease [Thermoanaerobaculia bacterium]